jgi:hypothetical protein
MLNVVPGITHKGKSDRVGGEGPWASSGQKGVLATWRLCLEQRFSLGGRRRKWKAPFLDMAECVQDHVVPASFQAGVRQGPCPGDKQISSMNIYAP